jgi:hypothetical protein
MKFFLQNNLIGFRSKKTFEILILDLPNIGLKS